PFEPPGCCPPSGAWGAAQTGRHRRHFGPVSDLSARAFDRHGGVGERGWLGPACPRSAEARRRLWLARLGGRDRRSGGCALRGWAVAGLVVLAYAAQTSLFLPLTAFGVRPDLVLIVICAAGLALGPARGAAAGLLAGLFVDVLTGRLVG